MTSLAYHQSGEFTKLMFIGDSGTGKTGALTSLVAAGYKLRILDLDNGLDALVQHCKIECSDKIGNVDFETRRDKYKATRAGPIVSGIPKAYTDSLALMTKWSDDTDPAEWGSDTIFVLDSLTALGRAAFDWAKGMNPGAKDKRNWYGTAQDSIEYMLALLTSENFHANVIVISHIKISELKTGEVKGHVSAIGSALGPIIPRYFNTMVVAESDGSGKNVRRKIKTVPTGMVDAKTPVPSLEIELPLATGLATLFTKLKDIA